MTINATATGISRHDSCGIGRWYSRGGPPCTLSVSVGCLKNNRGRRSLRLKLEVDEGIAASLSKNNGAGHECPCGCYDPARRTHHGGFDIAIAQKPVHKNHPGGDKRDLQHFARGKNGVPVPMSAKHAAQHSRGNREIRCSKENPRNANSSISGETGEQSSPEIIGPLFMLEESANHAVYDKIRSMQQAPDDKRPGRAMPKTTEKHYDDQIACGTVWAHLIASERNVKVVAQERGKRDMPASPKVGEPNGRVGKPEIILQMKSKAERGADCARGIAGKIKKYLTCECQYAQPGIHCDERAGITKNAISRAGEHRVSQHDFFEQTEGHE